MSENTENDNMAEEDEQGDNEDEHGQNQEPNEEEKKEIEAVKSSSPVVYIALILASFFALGVYEVSFYDNNLSYQNQRVISLHV